MLTKCPECELPVSDKAITCPHCGYPLRGKNISVKSPAKHKRLPNGFGRITQIKGRNLRNPYRVQISVGVDAFGRPIGRLLKPQAYFRTYQEAYAALVEYHKNPYELESVITVEKLFEKWSSGYFSELKSDSSRRTITSAWAYCDSIKNMRVRDLRARHIKGVMTDGKYNGKTPSANTQGRIKSLFNLMLDYAVEYELVDKNYARTFSIGEDIKEQQNVAKRGHMSFSDEEMNTLWANINVPYVDVILVQCYAGWRPQELGLLSIKEVNFEQWTFTGGMKTEAGRNRTVPIHSKIRDLVKRAYDRAVGLGSEYLFPCTDGETHLSSTLLTYDKYNKRFARIKETLRLNPNHRPHDGRKQFVTMAKKAGVDEYAIKYMVGHAINDITEKVYTDRDIDWLRSEIEKI